MGVVYEAWQEKPHRRVALKLLRPGLVTPARLRRFSHEIDFLGRLEHPAIARIYEAQMAETGGIAQPYFAMEYIEGCAITQYIQQQQLTTRARVALFKRVIDGVHYAHQKGVIHRDLKPANVLITPDGQPKILDFGVARAIEPDLQENTRTRDAGILLGTLSYMSPEQADANGAGVDIRSDVYALGVMLFEILTGTRPFSMETTSIHEAVRLIHDTEPPRLSAHNQTLKGDLEIIVATAMAKDKDHRYESAAALGDDLQRFLESVPIHARTPSVWYRTAKFVRRHKILVGASLSIFAALALGLIMTGISLRHAIRAQQEAHAQQELSRTNLSLALSAVDQSTAFIAQGPLSEIPEAADAREQLLKDAVSFYKRLAKENSNNIELRGDLNRTLRMLAESYRNSSNLREALDMMEQNVAALATLIQDHPEYKKTHQHMLAINQNVIGILFARGGDLVAAIEALEKANTLLAELAHMFPREIEFQLDLARNWREQSAIQRQAGNNAAALHAQEEAVAIARTLSDRRPSNYALLRTLARSLDGLGDVYAFQGNLTGAEQAFGESIQVKQRIVDSRPNDKEALLSLSFTYIDLGDARLKTRQNKAAIEAHEQAVDILGRLAKLYPGDLSLQSRHAIALDKLGDACGSCAYHDKGVGYFQQAYSEFQELIRRKPKSTEFRRRLARNRSELGNMLLDAGRPVQALEIFSEAYELYDTFLRSDSRNRGLRMEFGWMLNLSSRALQGQAEVDRLQESRAIWEKLARDYPQQDSIQQALRWVNTRLQKITPVTEAGSTAPVTAADNDEAKRLASAAYDSEVQETPPPLQFQAPATATVAPFIPALDTHGLREQTGQTVTVRGHIYRTLINAGSSGVTLLIFGTAKNSFIGVIRLGALPAFKDTFGDGLEGLQATDLELSGTLEDFHGAPQMVLSHPEQVRVGRTSSPIGPAMATNQPPVISP